MSRAIETMTGLRDVSHEVSISFLNALHRLCKSRQPIGKLAIVISPERAYLALRMELVDQFHSMQLHGLAARIARYSTRGSEILLICIGDDAPTLRKVPLAAVKFALAGVPQINMN
jgi:hypothetical protein